MVLGVLTSASSAWACDPLGPALAAAEASLLEVRLDDAAAALAGAEPSFACGAPTPPAELARYWILEGAVAALRGDAEGARDSFAAAVRADRRVWIESLGAELRAQRDAAASALAPNGTVTVRPEGLDVRIDGVTSPGGRMASGLHLVQVVEGEGVAFGRIVFAQADHEQVLQTGLVPVEAPAPAPLAVVPTPDPDPDPRRSGGPSAALVVAVGAGASFGEALSGRDADGALLEEPATKLVVPLELGGELTLGRGWVRAAADAAPLLGGRLLYGVDGEWTGLPFAFGGSVAGGLTVGRSHLGAAALVSLPGRLGGRAIVGYRLPDTPLRAELRAGANLAVSGALEPAAALVLSLAFGGAS